MRRDRNRAQDRNRSARCTCRTRRARQLRHEIAQDGARAAAGRTRTRQQRARPPCPRTRDLQARDRRGLGLRARGECAAARAHQRRRRRSGAACLGAGRPELADRRILASRDGAKDQRRATAIRKSMARKPRRQGTGQRRQSRRPHPRAADATPRACRTATSRTDAAGQAASLDTSPKRSLYRPAVTAGRLAQRESVPFTRERS